MRNFSKLSSYTLLILYILIDFALLVDSYKNPEKFEGFAFFEPIWLLLLVLLINLLMTLNRMGSLFSWFISINKFLIFPIFAILTIVLSVLGYFSPPNYIYSKLPLNPLQLLLLASAGGSIALLNAPLKFLKQNFKVLIFLSPLIILFTAVIAWFWPNDFFITLNLEDHLVENSQFILLVISSILSFFIAFTFYKSKSRSEKVMALIFLLIGLGLFFIAGEEISWGQRIFHLVSPSYFVGQNSQHEINVHNLGFFSRITNLVYVLIGLYGSLSFILNTVPLIRKLKYSRYFIVPWFLVFYFAPVFLYNFFFPPSKPHSFGEWSETVELLLNGGFFGVIFLNYIFLRRLKRQPI